MQITWPLFYALFWLYRCAFSVISQVFILQVTSLGDAERYQSKSLDDPVTSFGGFDLASWPRAISTSLTDYLGALFRLVFAGNAVMVNIGFQTLAFVGIVAFLRTVEPRSRLVLALLLMTPSFSVWSSVAGKEAITVMALGFICAYLIRLYRGEVRPSLVTIFAFFLIFIYKNHFLPAILFLVVGTLVAARVQQKSFLALFGGVVSLLLLFLMQDQVAEMAMGLVPHFHGFGNSTRPPFWENGGEVFTKAFEGMYLAFVGPTLDEAAGNALHRLTLLESMLVLLVLALYVVRNLPTLPVFQLLVVSFSLFWILFATYPFGVMNPGSAVRYRTGYEMLVFAIVVCLTTRESYLRWRMSLPDRRGGPGAPGLSRPPEGRSPDHHPHQPVRP